MIPAIDPESCYGCFVRQVSGFTYFDTYTTSHVVH
jgi:hypothetical protein